MGWGFPPMELDLISVSRPRAKPHWVCIPFPPQPVLFWQALFKRFTCPLKTVPIIARLYIIAVGFHADPFWIETQRQ